MLVVLVTLLGASPLVPPSLAPELSPPPITRGSTSAFRLRVDLGGLLGAGERGRHGGLRGSAGARKREAESGLTNAVAQEGRLPGRFR